MVNQNTQVASTNGADFKTALGMLPDDGKRTVSAFLQGGIGESQLFNNLKQVGVSEMTFKRFLPELQAAKAQMAPKQFNQGGRVSKLPAWMNFRNQYGV